MTVRTDDELKNALRELAAAEGISQPEAYELVMDVAKGLADVADIALRLNLVPVLPQQRGQ